MVSIDQPDSLVVTKPTQGFFVFHFSDVLFGSRMSSWLFFIVCAFPCSYFPLIL